MTPVLQTALPFTPWADLALRRLPGIEAAEIADAFLQDDAYAGQMAERDRLIADHEEAVHAVTRDGQAAACELLDFALRRAPGLGFRLSGAQATRPDGVTVAIDRASPMRTLGRLFQADYCILQKPEGASEHILTAAILCFPASWTLSEKIGRPLMRIHRPVKSYGADLGLRVQRLFDRLPEGRALWRANAHFYETPDLFAPKREADPPRECTSAAPYLRSERQVLFRLPETQATVFAIHTFMVARRSLTPEQRASLMERDYSTQPQT